MLTAQLRAPGASRCSASASGIGRLRAIESGIWRVMFIGLFRTGTIKFTLKGCAAAHKNLTVGDRAACSSMPG